MLEGIAVVVLIAATAMAMFGRTHPSRRVRIWAVAGVLSLLLGLDWLFNAALCGGLENKSETFYDRCDDGAPLIALAGVPLIVIGAWLAGRSQRYWPLFAAVVPAAVAAVAPFVILGSA